jgi:hypothetical protein
MYVYMWLGIPVSVQCTGFIPNEREESNLIFDYTYTRLTYLSTLRRYKEGLR